MRSWAVASPYHYIDIANDFCRQLLGGESIGLATVVNHLAHFADAFGALGRAAVPVEHIPGTPGARLDGEGDIPLAKAVAVADVHARRSELSCDWFSIARL
jgi:hypothetical protein